MIRVIRDKDTLKITVTVGSTGWDMGLSYLCSNELHAILLVDAVRDGLYEHIKKLRKDAYNRGWRDKASKKATKENFFSGEL